MGEDNTTFNQEVPGYGYNLSVKRLRECAFLKESHGTIQIYA